ncbi:MAG: hypothetical protein HQL72_12020 [Magnetococcales bacterium]|nr:hypothetical protein [Magnetococcales bacterium]
MKNVKFFLITCLVLGAPLPALADATTGAGKPTLTQDSIDDKSVAGENGNYL